MPCWLASVKHLAERLISNRRCFTAPVIHHFQGSVLTLGGDATAIRLAFAKEQMKRSV
jgi:hypothetical protein